MASMARYESRSALALAIGCAGLCLVACSGSVDSVGSSPGDGRSDGASDLGSLSVEFHLPSGSASTASYTLTGPNGFSLASTIDFAGSQAIGFLITKVPAGGGYALMFTATDGDGGESCAGMTTVSVTANQTTTVNLDATCTGGPYVPIGYGTIDVWVSTPAETSLSEASFSLTGPAGIEAQSGTGGVPALTVSGTAGIHFTLDRVPAGNGQVLSFTADTTTGQKCEASAAVNVAVNATAEAMLNFVCQ